VTPGTDVTGTHVPHDPSKDNRTVFVSNLDYTVSEDEVKNVLNKVGRVEEFRLARDFKGRSKGFGYCVFSSEVRKTTSSLDHPNDSINELFCSSERSKRSVEVGSYADKPETDVHFRVQSGYAVA
jgi:hypothetical protein